MPGGPKHACGVPVRRVGLLVSLVTLVVTLLVVEGATRLLFPNRYFVWPPGFERTFDAGEVIHGVHFPSQLTINAAGMRGALPDVSTELHVLAVGGSTTICVYLDDARAWPRLLQERVNGAPGARKTWVGNVGRPGHQTVHHVLQLDKLLPQHSEIDLVLLLIGVNDFLTHLANITYPLHALRATPRQDLRMAFSLFPGWEEETPWYLRNLIGRLWRMATWQPIPAVRDLHPMDARGEFLANLRAYRSRASRTRRELPSLQRGLNLYTRRVERILEIAQREKVRVLFLTQPVLWRSGLGPEERALLWAGGPPMHRLHEGAVYYSAEALAEGMAQYNETLLAVCRSSGAECLDVAASLPRTTAVFYDDAHFTEHGSALLAGLVADYLLTTAPSGP